jgi:alanyl-tRNA synthetase
MSTQKDYWDNPYQASFQARVTNVVPGGIILERTCFYPASGGQASDKGTVVINGKKYEVQEVVKEGERIIHVLKPAPQKDIQPGSQVEGTIDWERRLSLMRGHTAQHLLSAYMFTHFNAPTAEVTIQPDIVGITLKNQVSLDQLEGALAAVNKACISSTMIRSSVMPRAKAITDFATKIRGEMSTEDPLRIVEIAGWDVMCCGGTHVKDTAEIGPLIVTKFKGGREIKFMVGIKGMEMQAKINTTLLAAAATMNKDLVQVAEAVEKQEKNARILEEQADALSIRLLELEAKQPGTRIQGFSLHVLKGVTNKKIIMAWFNHFPPSSVLVVSSGGGSLQVYSNIETVKANEVVQALAAKFGGKGGGNPKVAQGMVDTDPGDIAGFMTHLLEK